jgi:hypothetical protein
MGLEGASYSNVYRGWLSLSLPRIYRACLGGEVYP